MILNRERNYREEPLTFREFWSYIGIAIIQSLQTPDHRGSAKRFGYAMAAVSGSSYLHYSLVRYGISWKWIFVFGIYFLGLTATYVGSKWLFFKSQSSGIEEDTETLSEIKDEANEISDITKIGRRLSDGIQEPLFKEL